MASKISIRAKEGSTFVIRADFVERTSDGGAGNPIIPNAGLIWSLTDAKGAPVNGKTNIPLVSASSVIIVLSGDDLALDGAYPARRYVTIKGTYDSLFGFDLELRGEASFQIENLVGV